MNNKNTMLGCLIVLFVGFIVLSGIGMITTFKGRDITRGSSAIRSAIDKGSDRIAVIYLTGEIISGRSGGGMFGSGGSAASDTLVEQIQNTQDDKSIKAVIIRINSPGGSAAASQEIYNALRTARKKSHKLYIASLADVAASGGYYVASACDTIYANPATLTGSIGVIMNYITYGELLKKYGVNPVVIKSGRMKDFMSPYREMTQEEHQLIQSTITNVHDQFIRDVADGRHIPAPELKMIADGRVFSGEQAIDAKLVDRIGGLTDAIEYAARKNKLKEGDYSIDYIQRDNPFDLVFRSLSRAKPSLEEAAAKRFTDSLLLNPLLAAETVAK